MAFILIPLAAIGVVRLGLGLRRTLRSLPRRNSDMVFF